MLNQLRKAIKLSYRKSQKDTNNNPLDQMSEEDKEEYFKRIF